MRKFRKLKKNPFAGFVNLKSPNLLVPPLRKTKMLTHEKVSDIKQTCLNSFIACSPKMLPFFVQINPV